MWSQETSVTDDSTAEPELDLWASLHHGSCHGRSFKSVILHEIRIDDYQVKLTSHIFFTDCSDLGHRIPFKCFLVSLFVDYVEFLLFLFFRTTAIIMDTVLFIGKPAL